MWSSFHSQWLLVNIVNRIWSHFTLSQQLYLVRWITPQKYLFLSMEHRPSCDWLVQVLSVLYMPTLQGDKPCAVNLSYVSESEVMCKPLTQQKFCKTFMVWKSDTCPVQAIGAFSVTSYQAHRTYCLYTGYCHCMCQFEEIQDAKGPWYGLVSLSADA